MPVTTFSSREFNQDSGRAKKAAKKGPVFITDRGIPSHVLLSIEDYRRLASTRTMIADALAMPPGAADIDLPLPERRDVPRPVDFD